MAESKVAVRLQVDEPGILDVPARPDPHLVVHVGPPVRIACERDNKAHSGLSLHGNIDIVPPGVASRWILKSRDSALIIRLSQALMDDAAFALSIDPQEAVLLNRFQIRDETLEHLAWSLKTEMDDGFKMGRLYAESIGVAMACWVLKRHSAMPETECTAKPGAMAGFRLKRVLGYIDGNLNGDLSLSAIAAVSGLSVSHCQRTFRNAVGQSLHQYVIRRRVELARSLLMEDRLSFSEVAAAVGFAHQSHLAYHLQRMLGVTPMSLRAKRHKMI